MQAIGRFQAVICYCYLRSRVLYFEEHEMLTKRDLLKLFGLWASFLILHYAYEFLPILPIKIISGINESFFQNVKAGFFAYLFVNVVEYVVRQKELEQRENFILLRLFSTMILPWIIFILWYTAPAYYGPINSVLLEVLYANIILLLAGICVLVIEQTLAGISFQGLARFVIIALFFISMSQYIIFTFKLPWADVFAAPPGY